MKSNARMTVLVDTREQAPWTFHGLPVAVARATMRTGDYSVSGHPAGMVIERKSFDDLYGSMTTGRIRFMKELRRLGSADRPHLIVEAGLHRVMRGHPRTVVNPSRMLDSLMLACVSAGIHVSFCESAHEAEIMAYRLMKAYWSHREGSL